MKMLSRTLAAAALAVVGVSAQAAVVISAPSFAGDVRISGFGIVGGGPSFMPPILPNTNTFTVDYTNLTGSLSYLALPNGNYEVSAGGTISLTDFGPNPITQTIPSTPIYTGFLGATGLTPGPYGPFVFGVVPFGADINFGFTIDYDGNASGAVMGALAALGFPFVNPDGAGSLTVAATFFADGKSAQLVFTESDLTWSGFANTLALADLAGANNGEMDGSFRITEFEVTANRIPEPATLALVGLGLLGAAAARRRRA